MSRHEIPEENPGMPTMEQRAAKRQAEQDAREAAVPVKPTNLCAISRNPKICRTYVQLEWDWDTRINWLEFGEASLCGDSDRQRGTWRLEARFTYGVTDFEHDSAYALRLPLIGVEFRRCDNHQTQFTAWVDPNLDLDDDHNGFHVPKPGYDPRTHPKTIECKSKECKGDKPWPHLIIPEGFYVPPYDRKLYEQVRGKKLDIRMGLAPGKGE